MKPSLALLWGTLMAVPLFAAEPVRVWQEPLILPTYAMGAPDRTPIFVERRSYQGAEAPVYPYPMWDAVRDQRVDKTYQAIYLENEFVQICVIPEIGGRVFSGRDKTNGYDFLYRQHVIKPALIGMVGAWISGGIEWNIPHHHRASTFMPVDFSFSSEADGSAVIRVGELELRHRMRWVVELRLRPGSSCVEQTVRLINRTASTQSFLFFANIAVHANPQYQVLFPPGTHWVTNHGKREYSKWPLADGVYNSIDFRKGVDVSWWKNHTSPISMFATGSSLDFVGGYDHGRQAGFVHVADRHTSPGKKFFTWGAGEAGQMWDRVLTDSDGPYIELMAGSYSDNQPDYSWIQPYQTKVAETFWYPVSGIGGLKNANREAAVNLEVAGDLATFGVAVTRNRPDLRVTLASPAGTVFEQTVSAAPGRPFTGQCRLSSPAERLTLRVSAGTGELISCASQQEPPPEMPETVRPPAPLEKIERIDDVYQAAVQLEQLHSAALDPEDYYREVLRRDPGHLKANTALGIRAWKQCRYAEAQRLLQTAVARGMGANFAPKEGEPHYYLGLVLRAQHQEQGAREAFERAAWVAGWESPANLQLAEMCCSRQEFEQAAVHLDRALVGNAQNVKALTLQAAVLRKLGRSAEALPPLERARGLDPLDPWPRWEQALAAGTPARQSAGDGESVLEPACDYAGAGLWEDAIAVLQSAATGQAAANPLIGYHLGYCLEKAGRTAEASAQYQAAAKGSPDLVFPFRRESFDVLQRAREVHREDDLPAYFLGNLFLLHGQVANAVAAWEEARRLRPDFGLVHRNLALAYARQPDGLPRAIASMETAILREPGNARYLLELDGLYESAQVSLEQRLAVLERHHSAVATRDDSLAREIALLVETGRFERALQLLAGHQFHVWEGAGRTAVHNSHVEAHLSLGHRHSRAGRHREALAEYQAALDYPPNLGTGRPLRGERLAETYFFLAQASEDLGNPEEARKHLELAVAKGPAILFPPTRPGATDEPESYFFAARALSKLGRQADAGQVFEGLIAAGKEHLADHIPMFFFASFGHPQSKQSRAAQAHYTLGLGLLGLGKEGEARAEFEQAVKLNPNHGAARKQLGEEAESALLLTPPAKPQPRINGARVFGVRPGSPFLYRIAATGERPVRFHAAGLPAGLSLDPATGIITGKLDAAGTHRVSLRVENAFGQTERELRIVAGEEIALTPPMGCNTYGGWGPFVTEDNVRSAAEALVRLGLADHGYCYVNIDDGWQGRRGGSFHAIQPNEKFGDLAAFCRDIHGLGLRAGIYSTPWTSSYEGFVGGSSDSPDGAWTRPNPPRSGIGKFGQHRFETNDARQIGAWGFDYFKYDWAMDRVDLAQAMGEALRQCGRDVVLELSNSAPLAQAAEFTRIGNMTRTTGDIVDVWDRSQLDEAKRKWALGVRDIWNQHKLWETFNRPGHWNMPCPLRVGMLGGWDLKPLRPTRLTPDEQYTHVSLWCLWSAPLIIGCPPERLDAFTLGLLTNDEVLEINQDPLGKQARQILVERGEVLIKDLEDGAKALGLFNVGETEAALRVTWAELGLQGPQAVRDLWRQKDLGVQPEGFAASVARHGVLLLRLTPAK